jgi:hypothetical protein
MEFPIPMTGPEEETEAELKVKDDNKQFKLQKVWLKRLSNEKQDHSKYRDRAREVEAIFRDGFNTDDTLYVPLYWSVVGVEHSGVYSNQPVPDVRPRNDQRNPLYLSVATVIQRGLGYVVDDPSFDSNMHRSVDDYLAMALGVCRVKVDSVISTEIDEVPEFMDSTVGIDQMGQPITEQVQVGTRKEKTETVEDQTIRWEYVPYQRFGWESGNSWKNVGWIYFRHRMTQPEIKERFGRSLQASADTKDTDDNWKSRTVDIYEIWDKKAKKVLFIAKGEKKPVEVVDDPLGLIDFFPCPEPMMMNLPSEEIIPQPDYEYIEQYDVELNRLQERRMALLEQIKPTGAYDQGLPELANMMEQEDGAYVPVQNLMARFAAAGGPENAIYHLPMQEKSLVLQQLTEQIGFIKSNVDEILGISDIVRGVTAASETATAQEIKGRWVGVRLTRKRECVQYTIRQMLRISAQLLASHITPENLQRMTQMQITEEMVGLLQNDMMMDFAIDIELDSTVAKDEFKERETRQEMLNGVAQFAQSVLPMVQSNAMPADVASAILRSSLQPYARYDRMLMESLESLPTSQQQLQQLNQQMQQLTQQNQQNEQGMQYWQAIATDLQNKATQAASMQKQADAEKKKAETREIMGGLPDVDIQPLKTVAEIQESGARTDLMERTDPGRGQSSG